MTTNLESIKSLGEPAGPVTIPPTSSAAVDTSPPADSASTSSSERHTEQPNGPPLEKKASQASAQSENFKKGHIAVIMTLLCIALFLAALDMTIITTALPSIAAHFEATTSAYTWVGSAYLLACAAAVPLWGKLSDIWGRRPVLILANGVFFVGSLLCAVSVSVQMLIGGRVVQGMGGGGLITLVNIVISDLFSLRERAKYFGFVGMVWAVASAIGPVLGGAFTEKVSWRWCFYINLPLDGIALTLLFFFLKLETPRTPFLAGIKAIDWVGVVTIVGGVVMFLLGLEAGGNTHPWASAYTLCLIIFGALTIALFFINEWRFAKYPIMPVHIFANRSAAASFGCCFVHGFVFISGAFYLPLYFQTVLSANPLLSGVYIFPFALTLSIQSAVVGVFIKRTGRYLEPIWLGFVFMTVGFGLFTDLGPRANWAKIIIYQIIAGIGVGPNFQAPLIALQSTIQPSDIATATSTFGFVRQLSTSMSVVLGGVVFSNELARQGPRLATVLPASVVKNLSGSSSGSNTQFLRALPPAQKAVVNVAYVAALRKMWIFYTAVSAVGILVGLLIRKKVLSNTHEKARTGLAEQERARVERMELRRKSKGGVQDLEAPAVVEGKRVEEKETGGAGKRI